MTFREATDALIACGISLGEYAQALGVSRAAVQQARAPESTPQHRPEPRGWREAALKLFQQRRDQAAKHAYALDFATRSFPDRHT